MKSRASTVAADRYMPFFPSDWSGDRELGLCSLATRGLWIELLGAMWKAPRRGYLESVEGVPLTTREIARIARCDTSEAEAALAELERHSVFSRDDDGVIYSRRMVRKAEESERKSEAGRKGAAATHGKSVGASDGAEADATARAVAAANESAMAQSESESESESKSDSENHPERSAPSLGLPGIPTSVDEVFGHYRKHHPRAKLGEKNRRLIRARLKEGWSVEELRAAIDGFEADPFHRGENEQRKPYNTLALYMRDSDKVQAGVDLGQRPTRPSGPRPPAPPIAWFDDGNDDPRFDGDGSEP